MGKDLLTFFYDSLLVINCYVLRDLGDDLLIEKLKPRIIEKLQTVVTYAHNKRIKLGVFKIFSSW